MERVHLIIEGNVHGVGFRNFIKTTAEKLAVTGFVKNTDKGVEVICEGEPLAIERIIALCKKGPLTAKVTNIQIKKEQPKGDKNSFSIEY